MAFDKFDKKITELELQRDRFVQDLNHKVAIKYAKKLGLNPVDSLDRIRVMLNDRIIDEVKGRKLRHIDMAYATQIPRTRITAIMNRHLERVSVDCMVQILNVLGIQVEISLNTPMSTKVDIR